MKIDTIKKKFREDGVWDAGCYYFCRVLTKITMRMVGGYAKRFGKVCEHRMVFKNRQMQDFTDNARALFEYLIEQGYNEQYEIIWGVSEPARFKNLKYKNVKFVTAENRYGWSSPAAFYYGNTAKYFFYTNNTADLNRYQCKGQTTINLWHGCGYKGSTHKNADIPCSKTMEMFDYALVPGAVFVETKSSYWERSKETILPLGYPRYDWMLDKNNNRGQMLKDLFGWEENGEKVVIWMPTFRKSSLTGYAESRIELPFDLPGLKSAQELQELDLLCEKENIFLIIKKHPLQNDWEKQQNLRYIRYVTDEMLRETDVQLYRLVGVCDALLSDYSSIAVDYLLMDRPLGFVLADYADYADTRGFVFEDPLAYMPGAKIYCLDDFKEFLMKVSHNEDIWHGERQKLLPQMHNITENYRKRIIDTIFNMDTAER